jgi:hypothetical protein
MRMAFPVKRLRAVTALYAAIIIRPVRLIFDNGLRAR